MSRLAECSGYPILLHSTRNTPLQAGNQHRSFTHLQGCAAHYLTVELCNPESRRMLVEVKDVFQVVVSAHQLAPMLNSKQHLSGRQDCKAPNYQEEAKYKS
eukprot:1161836-Pelagomonas_calceolata.AAC.2